MAGLFGHGLRSVDSRQIPPEALAPRLRALAGGGVVFALAVVLPGWSICAGVLGVLVVARVLILPGSADEVDGSAPQAS